MIIKEYMNTYNICIFVRKIEMKAGLEIAYQSISPSISCRDVKQQDERAGVLYSIIPEKAYIPLEILFSMIYKDMSRIFSKGTCHLRIMSHMLRWEYKTSWMAC